MHIVEKKNMFVSIFVLTMEVEQSRLHCKG